MDAMKIKLHVEKSKKSAERFDWRGVGEVAGRRAFCLITTCSMDTSQSASAI
jgi:hypothetical protein